MGSIAYLYCPSSNGFSTYSSSSSSSSCARLDCDSVFTNDTGRLGSRPILSAAENERQRDSNQCNLRREIAEPGSIFDTGRPLLVAGGGGTPTESSLNDEGGTEGFTAGLSLLGGMFWSCVGAL